MRERKKERDKERERERMRERKTTRLISKLKIKGEIVVINLDVGGEGFMSHFPDALVPFLFFHCAIKD